jgi:riboflavin biosynthesis pyrimidine reductase
MTPLELLFERAIPPGFDLPAPLSSTYGGRFGIAPERVYTNFVSSVDGVVALRVEAESGGIVSGNNVADRFVMGLLRASADAVLVGAGTFRHAHSDRWQAEDVYPDAADLFAALRRSLGLALKPRLVIVTASGDLDPRHPALPGCIIATTPAGEARLRGAVPATTRLFVIGSDRIRPAALIERLRAEGLGRVLAEGGPTLVGELVRDGLVDEMFLTLSPTLFGRTAGDGRKSLIDGVDLGMRGLDLCSVRRHGSHLFLHYFLRSAVAAAGS